MSVESRLLRPGNATLGVMGGGQLGRMFVHAAQAMGYRTVVLDPDSASPPVWCPTSTSAPLMPMRTGWLH